MIIYIPGLRLESEANKRDKWGGVARTKLQRIVCETHLGMHRVKRDKQPSIVTITRIAPRALDRDNLVRACKAVADSVATWIAPMVDRRGRVSGDDSVTGPLRFVYAQRKGKPRGYAVEIVIEPRTHECACGVCGRTL